MKHYLIQFRYNGFEVFVAVYANSGRQAILKISDTFVTASEFRVADSCLNFEGVEFA